MAATEDLSIYDFAKYALERNDEAIRFSETKAGFLFALAGLLVAVLAGELSPIKANIAVATGPTQTLLAVSLWMIGPGMIVLAATSLATVFPRLHVTRTMSCLFFGTLASAHENDTAQMFQQLTPEGNTVGNS